MHVSLPLRTDRLLIDAMTEEDAEAFAAYRSDPRVARYQSWEAPYPIDRARAALSRNPAGWPPPGEWVQLAIREGETVLGDVAVHVVDDAVTPDTVEIGISLVPSAQGRGVATEALRAVVDAAFTAGAHRVFAGCDARNAPVARLLERIGMRHEARLVDAEWWKGEWTTADTWAVLASEWRG
jgi:RimJ/RimL family protein N-acetyltransferase